MSSLANLFRSSKFNFGVAALSLIFGIYYLAAQTSPLPGSDALRGRWQDLNTMRGPRGHRQHKPRLNGPIDITILGLLVVVMGMRGFKFTKQENLIQTGETS